MATNKKRQVVLTILDGWGVGSRDISNAIYNAKPPTFEFIENNFPSLTLHASGIAVGVLWGDAGNSETGHIAIGAGRIVYQYIPRIIFSIRDGSFFRNEALLAAANHVKKNNGTFHIMGLTSGGSVHSYIDHVYALLDFAKNENLKSVALHAFTDGRDASYMEGKKFIANLNDRIKEDYPNAKIASVIGRFYPMDRDNNWDRIEKTYNMMVKGEGVKIKDASEHIGACYDKNIYDEFIEPAVVVDENDQPTLVKNGDALIYFNFREDSARQLSKAFTEDNFDKFPREKLDNLYYAGMTKYEDDFKGGVVFEPINVINGLGETLSKNGKTQLRIAETEKYAHVTYFFNGGREEPFPGEDHKLIRSLPSRHFEETPEMSAAEICQNVLAAIDSQKYDIIIVNFANADMVGHTGNFDATMSAVLTVDTQINHIMRKILEIDGIMVITSDHGNADRKINPSSGKALSEHSMNPAPFYLIAREYKLNEPPTIPLTSKNPSGFLADVAPTVLELMDVPQPPEMTGNSLMSMIR